jgi:uncharacterized membrane protein (UPF0127 family)
LPVAAAALAVAGVALLVAALVTRSRGATTPEPLARPIVVSLAAARPAVAPFAGWREATVAVGSRCVRVVVASSVAQRRAGLRGITTLGPYAGMLFVDTRDGRTRFTMDGTSLPLDLGLYTASGLPLERTRLTPCPASAKACPAFSPHNDYRLALEAPRGTLPSGALTGC